MDRLQQLQADRLKTLRQLRTDVETAGLRRDDPNVLGYVLDIQRVLIELLDLLIAETERG